MKTLKERHQSVSYLINNIEIEKDVQSEECDADAELSDFDRTSDTLVMRMQSLASIEEINSG